MMLAGLFGDTNFQRQSEDFAAGIGAISEYSNPGWGNLTLAATGGSDGGPAAQMRRTTGGVNYVCKWDTPGVVNEFDITMRIRISSTDSASYMAIMMSDSPTTTVASSYAFSFGKSDRSYELSYRVGGAKTSLGFGVMAFNPTNYFYLRLQQAGGVIRDKTWLATDAEPAAWADTYAVPAHQISGCQPCFLVGVGDSMFCDRLSLIRL